MPGLHRMRAGIQEQETAGSVSILRLYGLKAGLARKSCPLITQITSNRHIADVCESGVALDFTA